MEKDINPQTVEQILKEIKKRKITHCFGIWVPSLKKDVRFEEINTSQQKRLIKAVIDSSIYDIEFVTTLRDILKENCVDEIDIDNLTIIDQLFIAVSLRASCIDSIVPVEVTTDDEQKINVDIKLEEVLKLAKENLEIVQDRVFKEDDVFEVTCGVPTIKMVVDMSKDFLSETISRIPVIETEDQLKIVLGDAFIQELTKYVKNVVFIEKEGAPVILWNQLAYADRVKIIGTFNIKLLKQIINYTNDVKKQTDKIELISFTYKDKIYERRLSVDADFFMVS